MRIRASVIAAVAVVSVLPWHPSAATAATQIKGVRYAVKGKYTRIVLDLNRRCTYEVSGHQNPDRIAINIRGARAARALSTLGVGKGGVRRVRINRLSWGTQVVVDLGGPARWTHFLLERNGKLPDRIVVDVTPAGEAMASVPRVKPPATRAVAGDRPIIVAVDAGHGGKDPGTLGRHGLVEKKLTLDIAKRVARLINARSGFKAVLTRRSDVFVPLERRNKIAERMGADAFVSLHLNTAPNRAAKGAEIFFQSTSGAARSASQVLANPDKVAHDYGIDESVNDDLLHMLVDMNQQSVLARSEALAESILESFRGSGVPPTRSVKQKSFMVLRTISMPCVLVEAGFISNSRDANIVRKPSGRDRIAESIAGGIIRYLASNPPQRRAGDPVVVHRVRSGDTLWKISRKYGTPVATLRAVNKLGKKSVLRVGQELVVSKGF